MENARLPDNERANLMLRLEVLIDKIELKSLTNYEKDLLNSLDKIIGKFVLSDNLTDLQRRRHMAAIIAEELDHTYKSLMTDLLGDMANVGELTGLFMMSWHGETPIQKALNFNKNTLLHGVEIGDTIKSNNIKDITLIKREIAIGMASGEHSSKIARNLRKVADKRISHIGRVFVQSAIKEARWQAQQDTVKILFDRGVIKELVWEAFLEQRTCPICAALDGKSFKSIGELPPFPAHPRCRCVVIERTGLEKNQTRSGVQYFSDSPKQGSQFADMTYYRWAGKQPKSVQNAIRSNQKISTKRFKELMAT